MKYEKYSVCEYSFPLGLMNLKEVIERKMDFNVKIIDFNNLSLDKTLSSSIFERSNYHNMVEYIMTFEPIIVGFSTISENYHIPLIVSKIIKDINREIKISFGGPQASVTYDYT